MIDTQWQCGGWKIALAMAVFVAVLAFAMLA